jgi:hypothetical protein
MTRRRTRERVVARQGDLVVLRDPDRDTGRLLLQDDMEASYVDLAEPRHLEFDYMRWIRTVLEIAGAHRALHIGGAACALPRALAAADPAGRQEVCETDPAVLAMAREHLGLRRAPGLHVRVADGRAFVTTQPDLAWDAIVVDAYVGAAVPGHLVTVEAVSEFARVAPLTLINVVDNRAGHQRRRIAASLAAAHPRVWALGARSGNTVLAGDGGTGVDLARVASAAAADPSPARLIAPAEMLRLLEGAVAPSDRDSAGSRGARAETGRAQTSTSSAADRVS